MQTNNHSITEKLSVLPDRPRAYMLKDKQGTIVYVAHVNRSDVNCEAVANVLDIVYMIDFVFRGGVAPCDPCSGPSYPSSCP